MMSNQPLISVVMPAYNAEKTIEQSIQSVIIQTYKNWELIVIDDCSIDRTWDILCTIAKLNKRIFPFKNSINSGVSVTRNSGVSRAKGEWIAFLDSDDVWASDKLEKQVDIINNKTDAALIFTGSAFINTVGESANYILHVPETISYQSLLKQNLISCSSVLVKKELMIQYPMQHDGMHEDYAVWLQILRDKRFAYGINEPLLIYRLSSDSKSGDKKKAALMTYKVYRYLGLNHFKASYYFGCYVWRNIKKYRKIKAGFCVRNI